MVTCWKLNFAQQYQKKNQLTDVPQKYKHQSLRLKSEHENPQLRTNSPMLYANTTDASFSSRGDHQKIGILGGEK